MAQWVKNPPAMQKTGLIPRLGRFPGGGHGNPPQYPCLENLTDRGDWRAIVHRVAESDTTEATSHACTLGRSSMKKWPKLYHQKVVSP